MKKALFLKVHRYANLKGENPEMARFALQSDKNYNGPFPVVRVDGKQVFIFGIVEGKQFSTHQVIRADEFENIKNGEYHMKLLKKIISQFVSRPTEKDV